MPYIIGSLVLIAAVVAYLIVKKRKQLQRITESESEIRNIINSYNSKLTDLCSRYVPHSDEVAFVQKWTTSCDFVRSFNIPRKMELAKPVQDFVSSFYSLHDFFEKKNAEFLISASNTYNDLLSNIDGKSLDDQQRCAVLTDEDHNLVLAGAGSGKTLTIAGKVKYLCDVVGIKPSEILLIAFTRKSAEEMTERISNKLGIDIEATTFHKLGLDIIKESRSYRPDIFEDLGGFISNFFEEDFLNQPQLIRCLIEYFAYYLNIPADMSSYSSLGEMYEHEKAMDFETIQSKYEKSKYAENEAQNRKENKQTLAGEYVKSLEEVSIANFLFLNGVNYEYESLYPYESDDPMRKAYRPDFYLPDYDIYLEHFGIDKNNRLPWLSPIEEEKYLDGIQWKRAFHKQNGTKLIETYSYYSSEGRLIDELDSLLKKNGVKYVEPDFFDIYDKIYAKQGDKYFSEFIKLCQTFITLFKSNGYKIEDLRSLSYKCQAYKNDFFIKRTQLFLSIIEPILRSYEDMLRETKSIDFSDMINLATDIVSGGFQVAPYKYVIIDEFQDISVARYKLVKAILDQTNAKLLCVGDDWQSIYRFTGSDISLFTNFESYFGYTKVMRIEKTYRNSQQLIDEVGKFITQNPMQLNKSLRSDKSLDYPLVFWRFTDNPFLALKRVVAKIVSEFGDDKSILFLGRTTYDFEMLKESGLFTVKGEKIKLKDYPNTPVEFLTVHKSKGLEADNVVLLNFKNAILGFPNKISDDPILELVLSSSDAFIYAEERRLLYVALTRTKNRSYVLVDESSPSEFFREFNPSNSVFISNSLLGKPNEDTVYCPRCKTGRLIVRKNESTNQYFVGCSNFPQCDYSVKQTSVLMDKKTCPYCGGFLVKRKGPHGYFWGCTNYPNCRYTSKE